MEFFGKTLYSHSATQEYKLTWLLENCQEKSTEILEFLAMDIQER